MGKVYTKQCSVCREQFSTTRDWQMVCTKDACRKSKQRANFNRYQQKEMDGKISEYTSGLEETILRVFLRNTQQCVFCLCLSSQQFHDDNCIVETVIRRRSKVNGNSTKGN